MNLSSLLLSVVVGRVVGRGTTRMGRRWWPITAWDTD
jgi:hypothetical protein